MRLLIHQAFEFTGASLYTFIYPNEYIVLLEALLGNISEDNKKFFLQKTLSRLNEKDQMLLKTYFSVNMSLKETAERLFLHKNTLQYQLDKIWKHTGYNPREFKDAAILYVALKLVSYDCKG